MPKPNARLTLRLTPVTSNIEPERYLSLKIDDADSGQTVVQFDLLAEHLLDMFSGREVGALDGVPAFLIEERNRPTLGKTMGVVERRFSTGDHNEDTVQRWAQLHVGALGFHEFSVTKNNAAQYVVTFRFYEEPERAEVARSIKQATVDHVPPPAIESSRRHR
jgi:hypothetical protein